MMNIEKSNQNTKWFKKDGLKIKLKNKGSESEIWVTLDKYNISFKLLMFDFMEQLKENQNPLGTEPISRLIFKYSVPTALTLMVNYLYNIVDQMFVGQGVGITGMAATNVAFPLTIIATALGLLIGDGGAANISLCCDNAHTLRCGAVACVQPVCTGNCSALWGNRDGFSGFSDVYPDDCLGIAIFNGVYIADGDYPCRW